MERVTPVILAIGTTHPLNIAGVGLDARVAATLGVRMTTIIAGVSAQNADAVLARAPIPPAAIAAQFTALRDVPIGAIHVGALLDRASVAAVADGLGSFAGIPVVCDPVIAASGGGELADTATITALRDVLFARCALVTPNLHEAGMLLGRSIIDVAAMEAGARDLQAFGAGAILIKGGHLSDEATDVLVSPVGVTVFRAKRIDKTLRGTGDLLACAITARLAFGDALVESIHTARLFVRECIRQGVPFAGTRTIP